MVNIKAGQIQSASLFIPTLPHLLRVIVNFNYSTPCPKRHVPKVLGQKNPPERHMLIFGPAGSST